MKAKQFYPAVFSRYARPYQLRHEEIDRQGKNRGRRWILERVAVRRGERVLDLACGPGRLTSRLAAAAGPEGEVVGVDLAPGMLELAREHVPGARFHLMDIEALDLPDAHFDAAVCGHGLQFCTELDRALAEARRVLKDGGRLGASVAAGAQGHRAWDVFERVVQERLPPAPAVTDNELTRRLVGDPTSFRQAALDAGFASAHTEAVAETTVWESPARLVSVSLGWWNIAHRMEQLSPAERRDVLDEAVRRLRQAFGDGPIEVPGLDNVLYAKR